MTYDTVIVDSHVILPNGMIDKNIIIDEGKILKMGSPKKLMKELGNSGITVQLGQNINNVNIDHALKDLKYTVEDSRMHFTIKDPEKAIPEIIQKLTKTNGFIILSLGPSQNRNPRVADHT